jgi:hypothetical protein
LQIRLKLQKRQDRSAKMLKSENPVRQQHPRSKKPDIKKVNHDEDKKLTQEEMDYFKYVAAEPTSIVANMLNSNRQNHT